MIVALLAPGPSLAALVELPRIYDAVLAINHALSHPLGHLVDYWIALDVWVPPLPCHAPRLGMVTHPDAIAAGQAGCVPYPLFDYLATHPRAARFVEPSLLSMPAALWWADHLGAREVHIYGCDQVGDGDFRGTVGEPGSRSPNRWDNEKRACARVVAATKMIVRGLPT